MFRKVSVLMTAIAVLGGGSHALAQETSAGPGRIEVTLIPAGAAFVTPNYATTRKMTFDGQAVALVVDSVKTSPSFGNYAFGTAVTYNISSVIGVEGELGAMISTTSNLQFGGLNHHTKAPNFLNYSASAIVTVVQAGATRIYGAAGLGGLTMFERAGLGVDDDKNFLVGNLGGGVKWYAANTRWGLRADYRFLMTKSDNTAPAFFSQDNRYAHRVYAGVILNAAR